MYTTTWIITSIITITNLMNLHTIEGIATFTSDRFLIVQESKFRPLVTKTFDQLIYVTFPGYVEPKIKLETEKIGYYRCEVPFSSMDNTKYPINLDNLADGTLILSILETNKQKLHTLIINFETCKTNSVVTELKSTDRNSIGFATSESEFDIFLTKHDNCSEGYGCRMRYNRDGQLVKVNELIRYDNATSWSINTIDEKDFSMGYFYTVITSNQTILIKLNQDLEIQHRKILDNSIIYSTGFGNVNRCRGISFYDLSCEMYNENFEFIRSVVINTQPYRQFIRNIRIFNLPDGSFLILLILQVYTEQMENPTFSTYFHRVDQFGQLSQPVKFQSEICKDFDDIRMSTMMDNFYCFSISCRKMVQIKCAIFHV